MSKPKPTDASGKAKGGKPAKSAAEKARGTRETVESIIIAVILAFLFRAFEAEAFVIPTGSMAPTLQGRHLDVVCEKCNHRYRTGESFEHLTLIASTCPICRYTMTLDHFERPNERPFSGDRILVNKFTYELEEPQRWDVIVFKYPGNAKINYIKRLVGLPGERVRIQYGNIYVRREEDKGYRIARKSPEKVKAMLQLVDDTSHIPPELTKAGWPSRWQPWSPDGQPADEVWKAADGGRRFTADGSSSRESWLRYRHIIPSLADWSQLEDGQTPPELTQRRGELVTDFYAYNGSENKENYSALVKGGPEALQQLLKRRKLSPPSPGLHWVGDLAVECEAKVEGDAGELLLDLVEGGVHYQCRLNVADGVANLSIDGGFAEFQNEQGPASKVPTATTAVKGKGTYRLRLANVDDQLFLWVNGYAVSFDGPTTYGSPTFEAPRNVKPAWNPQDPGDLAPAGVGTKGAAVTVSRMRILRDVYYIAVSHRIDSSLDYDSLDRNENIPQILSDPTQWSQTDLFDQRRFVEFPDEPGGSEFFGPDQFFPCGDNSPASKDGRLWSEPVDQKAGPPPYVDRKLLIGKALMIYWPHTWNRPIPFLPNVQRMGLIR